MLKGNNIKMIVPRLLLFGIIFQINSIVFAKYELDRHHNRCPKITECPENAQKCDDSSNCSSDSLCCSSSCGKICIKQFQSGCENLQKAASRRAKALGVDIKQVRAPRCNKSGGFEEIQCDNEIVSTCWCVDEQGFELPGTKAPAAALVNCTAPKLCAAHTCRMFCSYGFALDSDGCPLCKCRDPCKEIRCPNSLDCQLEEHACVDPPCPPIPTCKRKRSLDNICPVGDPLRISDTVRPFLCGNDLSKPTCPPLYRCLVQSGHDYGVCCPASLKIQKAGRCPDDSEQYDCGTLCTHDLECPSIQKCCSTSHCGFSCIHPINVTECFHQKTLSEMLTVNEREGRGYIPQCTEDGQFEPKQCSRNELVCWCVNKMGIKIKGSMGSAENVNCSLVDARNQFSGRSVDNTNNCEKLECAAICEYGFKLNNNGCPTCKCDDPCEGYICPNDEECVVVRESTCSDFLCPTLPVCRPKMIYVNPCEQGVPLTDDLTGAPITCGLRLNDEGSVCPNKYECTAVAGSSQSVCCPSKETEREENAEIDQHLDSTQLNENTSELDQIQTMCQYLKDFSDNMEGTRKGMALALLQPTCDSEGNYSPVQCDNNGCWCVDQFGTVIPNTRGNVNDSKDCEKVKNSLDCLDLTCRMGCDYGFVLDEETSCPTCLCRDPCSSVSCSKDQQCQMVEVSCKDHYCPPVPACLPKKAGQCPYLIPAISTSCDLECHSDLHCNGTKRCCSNGCGTQCTEPLLLTGCQHQRLIAEHQARESGIPANQIYIPKCKEDGSYESLQCNSGKQQCWCVDFKGFEISQTRTPSNKSLDCTAKSYTRNCPLYKCSSNCDHGFKFNESGCSTCECTEPCSTIKCREDGEVCRLVNIECINWPCPPIPMCLPKIENPCQTGEPLGVGNEIVTCGPNYESCPSSHKCQLSPLDEYAVCCPKPRDVCFESIDRGHCSDLSTSRNVTRFYFNTKVNKCEPFTYLGCQGNHNNFQTEAMCNLVCPVLSQCERLREKNQKASERYKKPTFSPRCDSATGNWETVQCMEHVGVCWCVNPQGQPLKGTLIRGNNPECNFRQARERAGQKYQISDVDLILEEVVMQLASLDYNDEDMEQDGNSIIDWKLPLQTRCESLKAQCDNMGKFFPAQCDVDQCWCVDEAGNQLPHTNTFKKGEQLCLPTPIEYVDITIGFRGEYDDISTLPIVNNIQKIIGNLKGNIRNNEVLAEPTSDTLYVKLALIGNNKVDVAYRLEQMVKQQQLPGVTPDITKSRFLHQLGSSEPFAAERVIALEHREIVSQSPVSMVAPYHTALIVIAAASAFVICTLTLLIILYRRKMANISHSTSKIIEGNQRFLITNRPIYIELPNEKSTPPSKRLDQIQESAVEKE